MYRTREINNLPSGQQTVSIMACRGR